MTNEQIKEIENALNITLPEIYKQEAQEARLQKCVSSKKETYAIVYDDPKKIIEINKKVRKRGIYGSVPVLNNHFVIGYDGSSSTYYIIDINDDRGVVQLAKRSKFYHYNHEELNGSELSLSSFISLQCDLAHFFEKVRNPKHDPEPTPEDLENSKRRMLTAINNMRAASHKRFLEESDKFKK